MKRIIAALLSCLLLAVYFPSGAAESFVLGRPEVVQTTDAETGLVTQKLKISVSGGAETAYKAVTAAVLLKGNDINDPKAYTAFEQFIMPADGQLEAELLFDNDAGIYTVRVTVQGISQPAEEDVTIPTVSAINDFIKEFREGGFTSASMAEKILESGGELSMDLTIFSKLSAVKQQEVCSFVLKGEKNLLFEQLKESIDKHTALCAVSSTKDTSLMKEAMEYYDKKYFQFGDDTGYQQFLNQSGDFQAEVLEKAGKQSYQDFSDFKETLYEYTACKDFMNVSVSSALKKKIEIYAEYFDASAMGVYNNFSATKKNKVAEYLYDRKQSLDTMAKASEAFGYVVTNYDTLYPPAGQGGGGSRPSGGGSSQVIGMPPSINQEKPPKENTAAVATSFGDLDSVPWAEEAIVSLLREGVVSGRTSDRFEPEESVTRAEFIKILTGACNLLADRQEANFSDVGKSHWAYPYVAAGYSNGIIRGISETQFGVDDPITREDMCTIVYRVAALTGNIKTIENPENKFSDLEEAANYAVYSIQMLSSFEIVSGYPDGTFEPKGLVTRAEAAQLIYTFQRYLEGGEV